MTKKNKFGILLLLCILLLFIANLLIGSVSIPMNEVIRILLGNGGEKESWGFIVMESRLPQALTALLCGASLATCGLMLQTTFRNPLAGTSILGINSGASLGVALVMLFLGGNITTATFSLSAFFSVLIGAFLGAIVVLGIILFLSTWIKSNVLLLIAGIMIGYMTSSAISLLNFFATSEGVHSYVIWGLGNFGGVSLQQMPAFSFVIILGLLASLLLIKPLNALLLGERYAENLGINTRFVRNFLLLITGLLTAITTAFCGPIAFIDLSVPHITRMLLTTSNHKYLLPFTMLTGGVVTLLCNLLCTIPGEAGIIPLNAVTPMIGAPVIIYVLLKGRVSNGLH